MSLIMLLAPASAATAAPYFPQPAVHFTPPCYYQKGGWHDTAGAMQHPVTKDYHVFVGPVWQHLKTSNPGSTLRSLAWRTGWAARAL